MFQYVPLALLTKGFINDDGNYKRIQCMNSNDFPVILLFWFFRTYKERQFHVKQIYIAMNGKLIDLDNFLM